MRRDSRVQHDKVRVGKMRRVMLSELPVDSLQIARLRERLLQLLNGSLIRHSDEGTLLDKKPHSRSAAAKAAESHDGNSLAGDPGEVRISRLLFHGFGF